MRYPSMVRVKVCGITRAEDALAAVELGADAVGFVFVQGSPRAIDPETVEQIVKVLPPFVTTVGVFRDQSLSSVKATMHRCGLALAQLHGDEHVDYVRQLGVPFIKAISVRSAEDPQLAAAYWGRSSLLLDSEKPDLKQSGTSFPWIWARAVSQSNRVVLAGGLTPDNVAAAISLVHPWAVDVASGVESSPGIKDLGKVADFINRAKMAGRMPACQGRWRHMEELDGSE